MAASRAQAQLQGAAEEAAQDLQARIAAAEAAVAEAEEAAAEAAELQNDAAKAARVASGHAEDAGTQSETAVKVCCTCYSMLFCAVAQCVIYLQPYVPTEFPSWHVAFRVQPQQQGARYMTACCLCHACSGAWLLVLQLSVWRCT